jgi:hypothetical protein
VLVVLVLGATGYPVHLHFLAAALIDSAQQTHTTEDALHQISAWNNRRGTDSWTDSYDDGHTKHYFVRVSNRIPGLHLAPSSALIMRVTLHDAKLICVSVETRVPEASAMILEWFGRDLSPTFFLGYLKAAIPAATIQFPSSLPDAQKRRAFDVRTRCLLIPRLCATTEDLIKGHPVAWAWALEAIFPIFLLTIHVDLFRFTRDSPETAARSCSRNHL